MSASAAPHGWKGAGSVGKSWWGCQAVEVEEGDTEEKLLLGTCKKGWEGWEGQPGHCFLGSRSVTDWQCQAGRAASTAHRDVPQAATSSSAPLGDPQKVRLSFNPMQGVGVCRRRGDTSVFMHQGGLRGQHKRCRDIRLMGSSLKAAFQTGSSWGSPPLSLLSSEASVQKLHPKEAVVHSLCL